MTYAAEVLADTPLVYYRLGETSGTSAADSSGNSRTGTYSGTYTLNQTGLLTNDANPSVDFANGLLTATYAAWMDQTVFTVEAWVRPDTISGTDTIIRHDIDASPITEFSWVLRLNAGRPEFVIRNSAGTTITATAVGAIATAASSHIVATFDGTTIRVYSNGLLVATATSAAAAATPASNFYVGGYGGGSEFFDGRIDEVAFYATALSAARVTRHYLVGIDYTLLGYDAEVAADTALAHWPLGETSGTTMTDVSGNARNGVIDAGVLLNQTGIVPSDPDGTWELNAIEGGEVALAAWMAPAAALSAEAWIRLTSFTGNGQVVMCRADPALTNSAANKPWFVLVTNTGVLSARVYNNAGGTVALNSAAGFIALNTVYHIALTWDGTTVRMYVNGALVASGALTGVPVSTTTSTKNMTVGRDDAVSTYQFNGKVQHAAFYGTGLSVGRVGIHYLAGLYGANLDADLTGTMTPFTGDFDVEVTALANNVDLTGQWGDFTAAFDLDVNTDTTLTGSLTPYTGAFDIDFPANEVTLAGDLTPFTAAFDVEHVVTVELAGDWGPFTGDLTLNAFGTVVHLAGQMSPYTAEFTITNPVNSGDRSNSVNGRDRDGIGTATWTPPITPVPGTPTFLNFDVALAFTEPIITETAPPAYTAYGVVKPKHIDRIVIGGRDVTFFRGVPTPFPGFALTEPLGYGPTIIAFPQIAGAFEKPGSGVLRWMKPGSGVRIERVDLTADPPEVTAVDYRGVVVGFDLQGGSLTVQVGGEASGRAALMNRQPPLFPGRNDAGFWAMKAIRDLGLKPHTRTGPNTGVKVTAFGGLSMLEYLNQIVSMSYTRGGERWTIMPTAAGTYRMKRKDTETIRGTVYADDGRTVADLHRDIAEEPNRIYMTGVDPDGQRIRFGAYPGLKQTPAPTYPMFDGSPFSQGTTNADTDTGDGISVMIARLVGMKYLDYLDTPGGYDSDVTKALRELQDDAGITESGNMNQATWRALFDLSVTGFSLRRSQILPAASRANVRQWRRSASGAIIGRNPRYDPKVLKRDRNVDVGSGFTRGQQREWGQAELADGAEDNWVGTIAFNTGALIDGIHVPGTPITPADLLPARALRPGDNLWLPLTNGDGLVVHVSGLTISADGKVAATVDTRARDDAEVWEVVTRNRESRRSPYREWLRDRRASTVSKDATMPWDEAGGRLFERITIPAHTWTVFEVVAGQEGTVRSLDIDTNPNAEYVVGVFGREIRPRRLQRRIGDPLSGPGRKRWEKESIRDDLDESNLLLYVAGSDTEPCGYFPKTKTGAPDEGDSAFSAPLTGRWKDDAGFPYFTHAEPVLWVAVYADRDTSIPGGRLMWNQLEAGT